jgi:hypothetical protein
LTPQNRLPKIHPETHQDIHREIYRCYFNGKRDILPPESCRAGRFVAGGTFSRRYVPLLLQINDQSGAWFALEYLHRNLRTFRIKRLEFLTHGPIFLWSKTTHTNLD